MFKVPVPKLPTVRLLELVQLDPLPVTVPVPVDPPPFPTVATTSLTVPPFSILSVPLPALPTVRLPVSVQLDPLPVTVAVPEEPVAVKPRVLPVLLTVPPLSILSVPEPPPPMVRELELAQFEPDPVTVAVPFEPALFPSVPVVSLTAPLLSILSVPVPEPPTVRELEFVQLDPVPVTVAVPFEPALFPIAPVVLPSVPPPEIVRAPVAVLPTSTVAATAPVAVTPGPDDRSIVTVLLLVGTPFGVQFVPVAQFELYGIETNQTEYSSTFNTLLLQEQKTAGILDQSNVLSLRRVSMSDTGPAIINQNAKGLVTLIGSTLSNPKPGGVAIENFGGLFVRDVTVDNYSTAIDDQSNPKAPQNITGSLVSEYHSANSTFTGASLNMDAYDTPVIGPSTTQTWVSVASFGVEPDPSCNHNYTAKLEAALNSPYDVVYFPAGEYCINSTVTITAGNKRILGFGSQINVYGTNDKWNVDAPVFYVAANGPVSFEDFMVTGNPAIDFQDASTVAANYVILKHLDVRNVGDKQPGFVYQAASVSGHQLWIEDVAGSPWTFANKERIWAQQFDVEENYNPVKVLNDGSKLWIFGIKTEQPTTVIETTNGGSTELLGGLLYPLAGFARALSGTLWRN
jgi:hypothetical protein